MAPITTSAIAHLARDLISDSSNPAQTMIIVIAVSVVVAIVIIILVCVFAHLGPNVCCCMDNPRQKKTKENWFEPSGYSGYDAEGYVPPSQPLVQSSANLVPNVVQPVYPSSHSQSLLGGSRTDVRQQRV